MARREGGMPARPRRQEPVDWDALNANRPQRRLDQTNNRIARFVEMTPVGVNTEALRRYIETGDPTDRIGILSDTPNESQIGFLNVIDEQLNLRAARQREIELGIEILPPQDPQFEVMDAKTKAAADPVITLGGGRTLTYRFLAIGDLADAIQIWKKIQHKDGAESAMRTLIQTVNELNADGESTHQIIDMDSLTALVKHSE